MKSNIKIGKDIIKKAEYTYHWLINKWGATDYIFFETKELAIAYYCKNCCNPIYNEVHYDCESCPIKN